jgi:ketosteroid isomerase-like protein
MRTTTLSAVRATNLRLGLEASVAGDAELLADLYTDDIQGWTPSISVSSLAELAVELEERAGAFTDIEVTIAPIDVVGDRAYAEWIVSATHSGPFVLDDEITIDATGRRVSLQGMTVAEFRGERIKSFRQYWDEDLLLAGLGLLDDE